MGLNGQEVLIFATASPILLAIPALRRVCVRHFPILQLLSLVGIASFTIRAVHLRETRTQVIALGVGLQSLAYAAKWCTCQQQSGELLVGLLVTVVLKLAYQTLNMFWPIVDPASGGYNTLGLTLGLLAATEAIMRPRSAPSSPTVRTPVKGSALAAAVGLGATLSALHLFATDSGTIIAWSSTGFPTRGPDLVRHAPLTVAAVAFGMLTEASLSTRAFFVAAAGARVRRTC